MHKFENLLFRFIFHLVICFSEQTDKLTRDSRARLAFSLGRDHPVSCIAALPYFVPETREDLLLVVFLSKGCCNISITDHLVQIEMMVKPSKQIETIFHSHLKMVQNSIIS